MKYVREKLNDLSPIVGLDLGYFVGGGFWLGISFLATAIGGIILSSLFARLWPSDVYGQFAFLTSALGFVSLTALPGMGQAITQATTEGKDGVYKQATWVVLKWSVLGTLILITGSIYFYFRQNSDMSLAILASALAFPISSATSFYNSFLTGKKLFKQASILSIIAQYFSIVATGLALIFLPNLIWVALFSSWSTAIINILLTLVAFSRVENKLTDSSALKLGLHLSSSQFFSIFSDFLDKFFVPLFLGFSNNAVYAFAIIIPTQIHSFLKTITNLSQPRISELSQEQLKRDLWKKLLIMESIITIIVALYILFAPTIFSLLYPNYQKSAVFLSQIFSLSLLYFPGNIFNLTFLKTRNTKALYEVNFIYLLSTAILLILLIPQFGLLGAVLAKVASRLIQGVGQYYFFRFSE